MYRCLSLYFNEILCTYHFPKIKLLGSVNTNTNIRGIYYVHKMNLFYPILLTNEEAIIFLPLISYLTQSL